MKRLQIAIGSPTSSTWSTAMVKKTARVARMQISISSLTDQELSSHLWRIHTIDKITQEAIAGRLSDSGDGLVPTRVIFYAGRPLTTFVVSFEDVKFLSGNRTLGPYKFTAYHKPPNTETWARWQEGAKSAKAVVDLAKRKGLLERRQ